MNKSPTFLSSLLIGLIAVLLTNSVGFAKSLPTITQDSSCGEWFDDSRNDTFDSRILVTPKGMDDACSGKFTLQNKTGSPGKALSGYSLSINTSPEFSANVDVQFDQHIPILVPGLDLDVTATPINANRNATATLLSGVTLSSASIDASVFILDSIFASANLPAGCVISPSKIAFISLDTAPVLVEAINLAFQKDIAGSINLANELDDEFFGKLMEAAEDLSIDCLIDHYSKDFAPVVNIVVPYLSWLGSAFFGYLQYGGLAVGPSVLLSYVRPIEPTPVPTAPTLDKNDLLSVMQWMAYLMKHKEANKIGPLIGPLGTTFAGYAMGAIPKGYNNSDEITMIFERTLSISDPVCLGYDPNFGSQPDKAIIYFQGLSIEGTEVGNISEEEVVGFQFFSLEDGWELIYITPIPERETPNPQSLTPCPNETGNVGLTSNQSGNPAINQPQIALIVSPPPQPVGTCVFVRAKIEWSEDYGSMRMRFGNSEWLESNETEFERVFCTASYLPGVYKIQVESREKADTNWANPNAVEADYEIKSIQEMFPNSVVIYGSMRQVFPAKIGNDLYFYYGATMLNSKPGLWRIPNAETAKALCVNFDMKGNVWEIPDKDMLKIPKGPDIPDILKVPENFWEIRNKYFLPCSWAPTY